MKTLLILRHAKSSWKDEQTPDHDRPLNKRGKRDAPRIGRLLHECELSPELIISSTAKRARKTAAKAAKECHYEGVIEMCGELYLAPTREYLEVLRRVPNHVQRVMVVGHNPGAEDLVYELTGHSTHFPTASLAQVELDIEAWKELSEETPGRLIQMWRPRELE